MRFLALFLLLTSTAASAQIVDGNIIGILDDGQHVVSVFTKTNDTRDGVVIRAFATNTAEIKAIMIRGAGENIGGCASYACVVTFTKAKMISHYCARCEVVVTVTEKSGRTYRVKTEVTRP